MKNIHDNELFEAFATASENVYIYVCDMKTDVSRWSPNAVEYFDLEGEYLEKAGEMWLQKVHPDDRAFYAEDIQAVFEGRKTRHSCQYRALNRFGEYVWLECKGSVIKEEDGKPAVFAGLMTRLDAQNKYDSLTGLMTTFEFYERTLKGEGAILLVGIDDFRRVINSHGYSFGDEVLVEFSRRLIDICGKEKVVFRFQGDEFLMLAPDCTQEETEALFEEIRQMAETIGPLKGQQLSLSVSGGAVFYSGEEKTKEELVNDLEHSLEHAKNSRRGKMVFFSEEIAQKHKRAQILKEDIRHSIRNNFQGFELYFQPLVLPETHKIAGCEALLRWKGERIKDSNPAEFIRSLEYDGHIREVGVWVMEEALRQQKEWQEKYGDIYVSFNVSYQQFFSDGFVDRLIQKAKELEVNPRFMIVELTESCEVEEPEKLAEMFSKLREEGFRMALDDFGTAYASLELLKKLPADFIKIEHSFVRELAEPGHEIDMMIIDNLLGLCRQLNCKSVVEGVENENVDKIVGKMDATYLQGYCYSRPVCKAEFEALLLADREGVKSKEKRK